MSYENGGERLWGNALGGESAAGFPAREAAVDEHSGLRGCENRAVATAARGEDCYGNGHETSIAGKSKDA